MRAAESEQCIESARERLQRSRVQLFALAHAIKGDYPISVDGGDGGFPRSRLMRALTGQNGRMWLSAAALVTTVLKPTLAWRAGKVAGLLRPVLLRYVLPRLLRLG